LQVAGRSPSRLASLYRIPDRQSDEVGMDAVAGSPHDFPPDRLGLAADSHKATPTPARAEPSHLGGAAGMYPPIHPLDGGLSA
jgi:hypothetical protein